MSNLTTPLRGPHRGGLLAMLATVLIAAAPALARAATITVTSLSDPSASGQCTLRDAINVAQGVSITPDQCRTSGSGANYTIVFKNGLAGTITLSSSSGELPIINNGTTLTITGPSMGNGITVDGNNQFQIWLVDSGATLNLQYLTLTGASSPDGSVVDNNGALTVINSTITNNYDDADGGAIFNDGSLTVTNTAFDNNSGESYVGSILSFGKLDVTNSTFVDNIASDCGAIGSFSAPSVINSITNSTFNGNVGTENYGAICNDGGPLNVTNSTFDDNNSIGVGGAVDSSGGLLTITNSTFDGNSAGAGGGAIYAEGGTVDLKGTILATAASTGGNCSGSVITDEGYNLADDGSCGFTSPTSQNNVADADLKLDHNGLQNNGGPTQTIALLAGSIAINQIPVADCTDQSTPPLQLTTDQRGVIRPQFTACDIGAYEYDTARSLKTAALAAIQALSGGNRHDRQQLQIAASNLTLALRYYWQGNSGNLLNPVLGILDFQAEQRAVTALQQILVPGSQLAASAIANYEFNIALADRTLAEVAISGAGGNTQATALVTQGDAASSAGNYALAIGYYSRAWQLAR